MFNPPTSDFPFVTLPGLTEAKLQALLGEFHGWGYGLDFKIQPLDLQGPELIGTSGENGARAKKVDCSGFVRWAVHHASAIDMPDGSANQHDWVKLHRLKRTDPAACTLHDGVVRICFLTPEQGGGIGHVLMVCNGRTYESHGGKGPDSRAFDPLAHPWMGELDCFVAARPA